MSRMHACACVCDQDQKCIVHGRVRQSARHVLPPPGRADAAGSVGLSDGEWVGVTALWNSDESPSPPCTLQKYTKDLYVYKMTH